MRPGGALLRKQRASPYRQPSGSQAADDTAYPRYASVQQHHQRNGQPDQKPTDKATYRRKVTHYCLRSSSSGLPDRARISRRLRDLLQVGRNEPLDDHHISPYSIQPGVLLVNPDLAETQGEQ